MSTRGHRGRRIPCWGMQTAGLSIVFCLTADQKFLLGFLDFFLAYLDASPVLSQKVIHTPRTCHLHVIWICSWLSFRIFCMIRWVVFLQLTPTYFPALEHYLFGFFSCLFRAMSQRFEMCERTKRIASTPQLNLPAWFLIPIIVIILQTKRPDQAVVPLLSSPLWLREYLFMNAYWLSVLTLPFSSQSTITHSCILTDQPDPTL